MINRRDALSMAACATTALALTSCSSKDSKSHSSTPPAGSDNGGASDSGGAEANADVLEQVKVTTDFGAEPAIELEGPLEFDGLFSKVVSQGKGAQIAQGDFIVTRSAYFDPESSEMLASQWQAGSFSPFAINESSIGADAAAFFTSIHQGSRFLMAGQANNQKVLQVGDVVGIALKRAEGSAKKLPEGSVAFTVGSDGAPVLDGAPEGDPPAEQVTAVAIEGSGPAAAKGDTLVMHYRGWDWQTGEEFDSSWGRGEPFVFQLGAGEVIAGWDSGLQGQKQGSQVLLVLPPSAAYGTTDKSQHELAGKTLIFVADVLYVASASK